MLQFPLPLLAGSYSFRAQYTRQVQLHLHLQLQGSSLVAVFPSSSNKMNEANAVDCSFRAFVITYTRNGWREQRERNRWRERDGNNEEGEKQNKSFLSS